jgi:hypothetical protein
MVSQSTTYTETTESAVKFNGMAINRKERTGERGQVTIPFVDQLKGLLQKGDDELDFGSDLPVSPPGSPRSYSAIRIKKKAAVRSSLMKPYPSDPFFSSAGSTSGLASETPKNSYSVIENTVFEMELGGSESIDAERKKIKNGEKTGEKSGDRGSFEVSLPISEIRRTKKRAVTQKPGQGAVTVRDNPTEKAPRERDRGPKEEKPAPNKLLPGPSQGEAQVQEAGPAVGGVEGESSAVVDHPRGHNIVVRKKLSKDDLFRRESTPVTRPSSQKKERTWVTPFKPVISRSVWIISFL